MELSMELKYEFNNERYDSLSPLQSFNYVICSTPRSGSTLLAKGLLSTLVSGLPHEYFNIDHKNDYQTRWDFKDIETYILLLKKYRVSENGVFGFKLHYNQYVEQFEKNNLSDYFEDLKYIRIIRKDKVLQGISLEKALQTNFWSSEFHENAKLKARFNYYSIKKNISNIQNQELCWQNYFDKFGITPYTVYYEELESNYSKVINDVINYLEIKDNYDIPKMPIAKQRDISNILWKWYFIFKNLIKL